MQYDLRQILITEPIFTAADTLKGTTVDRTPYLMEKGFQGFPLPRVELFKEDKVQQPIIIEPLKNRGRKINGKMLQLYTIIDGRHRVAKALSKDQTTISATILSEMP